MSLDEISLNGVLGIVGLSLVDLALFALGIGLLGGCSINVHGVDDFVVEQSGRVRLHWLQVAA